MSSLPRRRFSVPTLLLRLMWTSQLREKDCAHMDQIRVHDTDLLVCKECVALGDTWPELRMCMICGYVGCCDASKNKHAKKHFHDAGHSIIRPVDRGIWYNWIWCYEDDALLSPVW